MAMTEEEILDQPDVGERMIINIGPSHPATHGTFRAQCLMNGERIVEARAEIGYLHRCFEKMCEEHTWTQAIPFTDRLNYCSSFMNNVGYCKAVEDLMEIAIPERAKVLRIILLEFNRIMDHMTCIGPSIVDLGAITNFWYTFRPREEIYELLEACCGARLTVSYGRIGGLAADAPAGFEAKCRDILKNLPRYLDDVDRLNTHNPIYIERTKGVGAMSAKDALDWGWTGPCLRACGVPYDVRRAHPYYDYETYEFEVPIGRKGDTYDRYLVRLEEVRQSMKIIGQALERLRTGPVMADDPRVALPDKGGTYTNIESLMNHFKIITEGIRVPPGEVYSFTEAANGELGFYIVSDGSGKPYRIKVRPPCFPIFQAYEKMLAGHTIADAVAIMASLNIIAGELDR
jgi:NADH dehydrogenase I D subunit